MSDQMNLFQYHSSIEKEKHSPLAERMRPQSLDEIIGQEDLIAEGKLLRRAIESNRLSSLIFWGPPGSGKTTLAKVIAETTKRPFAQLNAVTDGLPDLRKVLAKADEERELYGRQLLLFIDEIHRFNKSQQDGLLPAVEAGHIVLIGATTQNPHFSLNPALLSRSLVFQLQPLEEKDIKQLLEKALKSSKGFAKIDVEASDEALSHFARMASGDVRKALNGLELAVLSTPADKNGMKHITLEVAEASIQRPAVIYDNTGDEHYDIVSAFIKSMRGSDPDAALYYMARMLDAGEDPLFIARRMVIFAAEDVGLADPQALILAQSAAQGFQFVGMPEGRIILSEACVYLALAPKSNASYKAIDKALQTIRSGAIGAVPNHLKDAHYKGAESLSHGLGYKYPHNYPGHWVEQDYLPEKYRHLVFYEEDDNAIYKKKKRNKNE